MRTLEVVAREASSCEKCALAQTRTQVVFGNGDPNSDLMFIGEAPGFHEDRQGIPFVGAAGGLLNGLLESIGLDRDHVYVANVLKCLRYTTQVQLGDGSWERVGRLVRERYSGTVKTVEKDGSISDRRVRGWYESPLGDRRVFRVTYRSAKFAGRNRVAAQMTGDHEVLTDKGFVPVEEVSAGARIATGVGFSELAYDVICGSLLGDASINKASSYLSFSHSATQRAYAQLKASLLSELFPRSLDTTTRVSGVRHPVIKVRTLAHRALRILRAEFYAPKKRVPSWLPEQLNARMLAFWFMDDGHMRIREGGRRPLAEIATNGFSDIDRVNLLFGLRMLGMDATARRGRLHFDVENSRNLSEVIAPFVPPSMRYKLVPDIATRVPFDLERLSPGPPKVEFDEAIVEEITDRPRSDRTFFCIDVEGTHNFVTSGGVVHNCRPPGNRDPQPDEIEACTPWLREQVQIVDPLLICTLGNFATRLLLNNQAGISRVRGQRFGWHGRTLIPTFHPAAVLHSGRSGSTMAQMEDDFRLLGKVLDELRAARPAGDADEQLGLF